MDVCSAVADIPSAVDSRMRDPNGEARPQTHVDRSPVQHRVYTAVVSYIVIWCASTRDNTTHEAYDFTQRRLYCQQCFPLYKNIFG